MKSLKSHICNFEVSVILIKHISLFCFKMKQLLCISMVPVCLVAFVHACVFTVSGRSSAYGDTAVEGHPAGPGSVSSSTGAISTTTAQQEGEGSEGEGETEGDIHTSNRSDITECEAGV